MFAPCDGCGESFECLETCNGWLCQFCREAAKDEIEEFEREHARKDFEQEVGADSVGER